MKKKFRKKRSESCKGVSIIECQERPMKDFEWRRT